MVGKEQELEKVSKCLFISLKNSSGLYLESMKNLICMVLQLQRETQKWRDYFSQWTRDKEKLKAENDKLRSEISNFKTQDLKRQEEFDKILLNAKERTTEAEVKFILLTNFFVVENFVLKKRIVLKP